ncbi:MAG: pectin acetylesterase-family hydrolase [Myxococcota bacterium]
MAHTRATAFSLLCVLFACGEGGGELPIIAEIDEAPAERWSFVSVPESRCANDTRTGFGFNRSSDGQNLFIYLEGGGACWDFVTCYAFGLAARIEEPFGAAEFQRLEDSLNESLFDRNDEANPLKSYNLAFIPYCTGDVHAGATTTEHNGRATEHRGYSNMSAYLDRLASELSPQRVVLAGSSAGGYGTLFNLEQVRAAFPSARVDVINDGGPPLPPGYLRQELLDAWRSAWNLAANEPTGCVDCATDLTAYVTEAISGDQTARISLLSYTQDPVIAQFHELDTEGFQEGLDITRMLRFDGNPQAQVFIVDGTSHTMFADLEGPAVDETSALEWLTLMLRDDPRWTSLPRL